MQPPPSIHQVFTQRPLPAMHPCPALGLGHYHTSEAQLYLQSHTNGQVYNSAIDLQAFAVNGEGFVLAGRSAMSDKLRALPRY